MVKAASGNRCERRTHRLRGAAGAGLDPSGRAAPDARSPPAVAGGPVAYSAVRDGHPQPVITAVIPPGPVSKRSNETDSMTTT
jgi:hypothetical protein